MSSWKELISHKNTQKKNLQYNRLKSTTQNPEQCSLHSSVSATSIAEINVEDLKKLYSLENCKKVKEQNSLKFFYF